MIDKRMLQIMIYIYIYISIECQSIGKVMVVGTWLFNRIGDDQFERVTSLSQ